MKTGFIITARMKSTRLPKKATLEINNRETIAWMIDRIKQCDILDDIIIATSTNPQDDILCTIAKREGIKYYRGSENDVLKRIHNAAVENKLDYIISGTADNILIAYDFIKPIVDLFEDSDADLITAFDLPLGFFSYGIAINALKDVLNKKQDKDTEIWGKYFKGYAVVKLHILPYYQRKYRFTLDYPDDLILLKTIFKHFGNETYKKTSAELIAFLNTHPDIAEINMHCKQIGVKT